MVFKPTARGVRSANISGCEDYDMKMFMAESM